MYDETYVLPYGDIIKIANHDGLYRIVAKPNVRLDYLEDKVLVYVGNELAFESNLDITLIYEKLLKYKLIKHLTMDAIITSCDVRIHKELQNVT